MTSLIPPRSNPDSHNNSANKFKQLAYSNPTLIQIKKLVDRLKHSKRYNRESRFQSLQNETKYIDESIQKISRLKTSYDSGKSRRKTITEFNVGELHTFNIQRNNDMKYYHTQNYGDTSQNLNGVVIQNKQVNWMNEASLQYTQQIQKQNNQFQNQLKVSNLKKSRQNPYIYKAGFIIKRKNRNQTKKQAEIQQQQNNMQEHSPKSEQEQKQQEKKQEFQNNNRSSYNENIKNLQFLYQCFSRMMIAMRNPKKNDLIKQILIYIELIKSRKFNFLEQFIFSIESIKLKKLIFQTRILEYMSIMHSIYSYVTNQLKVNQVNLNNLIGHAASNLIFLSKIYIIKQKKNNLVCQYEKSIQQYLKQLFQQDFKSIQDLIVKIKLNNQTINIVSNKFNKVIFSKKIKQHTKGLQFTTKILKSTFSKLLEYVAFFLHQNNLIGKCISLQIPPVPFLGLPLKKYTIVIQPCQFLIVQRQNKLYVRANTFKFLAKLSILCNIIFWTNNMPQQIDKMLQYLQKDINIQKTLYRYHMTYMDGRFIKNILLLGRDINKTLIIDSNRQSFSLSPQYGIQMKWDGLNNDSILLNLLDMLNTIIQKDLKIDQGLQMYEYKIYNATKNIKKLDK